MILNKDVIDTKRTACISGREPLKETGMKLTGIIVPRAQFADIEYFSRVLSEIQC